MSLIHHTFHDMTTEDMFQYNFHEEEFLGHKFIHIGSGVFKAEPFFDLT